MIEPPRIVELQARPVAVIPLLIPKDTMAEAFRAGVKELLATLEAQRLEPAGPVFAHHLRMSRDRWDFELGILVPSAVKPTGRVVPGNWPAMRVVRTVLHGGYEGLFDAWAGLGRWIEEHRLREAADLWEVYTVHPDTVSDPAEYRTELIRPLLG